MKKIIILLNLILLFASCRNNKTEEQAAEAVNNENMVTLTDAQYKNAGIQTGKLISKTISSVLKLNGKIDVPPQNMVSVSVPLGGYLESTKLLPGMHINKGEVLAVMQDPQYIQLQQDYLTAKTNFAFNENEYNRQRTLNESKATSDKVFEQTKANYQTQAILIKSLEQKLKLIGLIPEKISPETISKSVNIYSPIKGYVSTVNANIGKYINPSDVLFELVNPEDIHLALNVFEKDVNKLAVGQRVFAYTNTNPEKKYPCEIILISKNLSQDNSAIVHCHFEQYDKNLLPGMFMNADIEISNTTSNALPDEAFVRYQNKQYVFIVKEKNSFEMQEIKSGSSENGYTEMMDSEKFLHETFVTKGAYTLLMTLKNAGEEE